MEQDYIRYQDTGFFSSLICDYLDEKPTLSPFYNRYPKIENFKAQIEEKSLSVKAQSRIVLVKCLKKQYKATESSALTLMNIDSLAKENTFTVTTGHQLNIFTGPLYFLYKIISVISLTKRLKHKYPNYNFVPIYWMATEDHDFDEIKFFNFKGKKIQWNKEAKGAVGELSTKGLDAVYNLFSKEIGSGKNAIYIKQLFECTYLKNNNLTDATRYLTNELFKDHGLVVIDAADKGLKQLFVPFIEDELLNQSSFKAVTKTNKKVSELFQNYNIQVNPREINLFYLRDNIRERIAFDKGIYKVLNTEISFSQTDILKEISIHPERFSPNVIMRPLYQEVILPNLCYIGGGGELAYWLQLRDYFNRLSVTFPMLLLRNSVLIQSKNQFKKLKNLGISNKDIFLKRDVLINKKVKEISNIDIDFSVQKEHLKQQFEELYKIANQTDKSFLGAVKAQEVKQLKGLNKLEKRLLKAQKRKLSDEVLRITELQNQLFPNQGLQERNANFSEFYLEYGDTFILKLIGQLQPLKMEFLILNF